MQKILNIKVAENLNDQQSEEDIQPILSISNHNEEIFGEMNDIEKT